MGGVALAVVTASLLVLGPVGRHVLFYESDAPLFVAVAKHPFGTGHPFPGVPIEQGVAYRFGRIFFPFLGWLAALGRPVWVPFTLTCVYALSFALAVALAGEHLRRGGRSPWLGLLLFATPYALLVSIKPVLVAEPTVIALILLSYLYERDGRARGARVAAALAILTREMALIAFVPMAWRAWRERGLRGLAEWAGVLAPYLAWATWVRLRVGQFPFLDPARSRRGAIAFPLSGWLRTLDLPMHNGQGALLFIGAVTVFAALLMALRGDWVYPVTHGAIALGAFTLCYGAAVWAFPGEAIRVMAPTQVLMIIAACSRSDRGEVQPEPERQPVKAGA